MPGIMHSKPTVPLSLLLTSQLSLGLQLGREGEDGKGGQGGLRMRDGHGAGNKGQGRDRGLPGLGLDERLRAKSGKPRDTAFET